ncbi:MAG: hypothetical protein WBL74_02750 [Novosphingobium sp.]|uniref:hypothetical protein n=1 Tax=Novosphingobium sp. TaxID=1874826 RepID=UPI003C7EA749
MAVIDMVSGPESGLPCLAQWHTGCPAQRQVLPSGYWSGCKIRNSRPALCTGNLYLNSYVANANSVRESNRRYPMRSIIYIVLPIIAAASVSGLMFTATLA